MPREMPDAFRELLARQEGVISRTQALASGVTPALLRSMLRAGRWQRLHQGVYVVFTGEPGRPASLWAALLRAGRGAILSHSTAAEVDRLIPAPGGHSAIHISVPGDRRVDAIRGTVLHRRSDISLIRHPTRLPPRTRIEETALDLALCAASLDDALGWLARACGSRQTTAAQLAAALARRPRAAWRRELASALAETGAGSHSLLELRYVRDVERPHGLPRGQRQVKTRRGQRTEYKDVLYQPFGVGVETDGAVSHPVQARWRDQQRDNAAAVSGVITLRYGWADVTQRPCAVAAQVAAVLRSRGWTGRGRPCRPGCPLGAAG